jgi:hypothetical protein
MRGAVSIALAYNKVNLVFGPSVCKLNCSLVV